MRTTFICWAAVTVATFARGAVSDELSFRRDIRPILAENCFQCHGPDEGSREAELRLDVREAAIGDRFGSVAIVPGDAAASDVIDRVTDDDPDFRMPPEDTGKRLSAEQIELLRRWIEAGAAYERHWAFEPVQRPALPPVKQGDWTRSAIDHFILAKLEARGLAPSPVADRHTLIRRLYLDLLGVLPSVEEADALASDDRTGAYDRLVDRLLADPRLGERWGRHWLDQARYADSHGYTIDNERVMWPYRDWVINAINRDLPFDQFTIDQLAGDLLPQATLPQKIATGFHRNTLINTEGGVKADQFRDEQVKDRVDTTGGVWLGLTVGCAKCHSHKYDPVSQAEYYELYAFFNSTADNNSVAPTVAAPTAAQRSRLGQLDARRAELQAALAADEERAARQTKWEAELAERQEDHNAAKEDDAAAWTVLELGGKSKDGATFKALEDHSLLAAGNNTVADDYELTARTPVTTIRSVRLEVLTHEDLPKNGPGRADNGNFVLAEFWLRTGDGREPRFNKARADHSQPKFDVAGAIDGNPDTGWAINGSPEVGPNHNRVAWFVLPAALEVEKDHALTFYLEHHRGQRPYNIGRLRISVSAQEHVAPRAPDELAKLAAIDRQKRVPAQQQKLDDAFLRGDAQLGPIFAELQSVAKARDELNNQVANTMVMRELDQPRATHVHKRGDFLQPGRQVEPGVPDVLPALPAADNNPTRTRLDFARWLVDGDNPLTPRVRVNRVWMRLFGRGLVETENDFGTQGALPTHPRLLDWLADEHVRRGWSTKGLLRLIVTSAAYRQQSQMGDAADEGAGQKIDPENYLLWRQNRVRVEGEIVRDLALSAGGLLSAKIGGPSVYPPQPEGVYAFTQQKKSWPTSQGEDRYRRGMYTFFYRSAPYPMLSTFDAPKFNQTCTGRDRSNTPLQSLTVANDPALFEAARELARRTLAGGEEKEGEEKEGERGEQEDVSPERSLTRMFRICMIRPPSEAESAYLKEFYQQQLDHFDAKPQAAGEVAPGKWPETISQAEAAAYVASARVLINLDEFITRE